MIESNGPKCEICRKRTKITGKRFCIVCKQAKDSSAARLHAEFKKIIYKYYGDKCACCGETEVMFLTIDHINNDGAEARRKDITGGANFYRHVAKSIMEGHPPTDLQLLCRNCNWGKHVNSGICPHLKRYL